MKKVLALITVLILGLTMQPALAATLDQQIAAEVKKATLLQALPKTLTASLIKARTDKSPWLDQICSVDFPSTDTPVCEGGDLTSKRIVVLYGDSHASMWMSALDVIGKKQNFKVRLIAKLACPLVKAPIWSYQLNKPFNECNEWQAKVLPQIAELKPEMIIVTDQWKPAVINGKQSDFDTPFFWEREFPIAMAEIATLSKKVFVIGNNPSLTQDPVSCISRPRANMALCSAGRTQADNARYNKIEAAAARKVGATYIDTVRWACTATLCPVVIKNKIAYFDQWHFSESYVKYLLPALEAKLK
jgi:hypothetical protein